MKSSIRVSDRVRFYSTETSKTDGKVQRIEFDRQYGEQYLVSVLDDEMGIEYFWIKNTNISRV